MKKLVLTFLSLILAIVLGGIGALAANHWHKLYRFHDLGAVNPTALNNRVDIAGSIPGIPVTIDLFLWTPKGGLRDLGHPNQGPSPEARASGINDKRQIASTTIYRHYPDRPFAYLWTEKNGFEALGNFGGDSQASGINARGEIVGYSFNGEFPPPIPGHPPSVFAFLWTRSGGLQNLGTLPGGNSSLGFGINDKSEIAGELADSFFGLNGHAALWTKKDGWKDLGGLPGAEESAAVALNNRTQIIGMSRINNQYRAFIWTAKQGMKDLAPADGYSYFPHKINDRGQVVGEMLPNPNDSSYSVPFLWTEKSGMKDLNDLLLMALPEGGRLTSAAAINFEGQIIGQWLTEGGQTKGYLLTPYEGHCWGKY